MRRWRVRSRLRRWWRRGNPRWAKFPRVLANGVPKAGTHLLVRCVELLPGMRREELELYNWRLLERLGEIKQAAGVRAVPVGIEVPQFVEAEGLRELLEPLGPGEFTGGHMAYSTEFAELLKELNFRSLLIIRDPRDIAVSSLYHTLSRSPIEQCGHSEQTEKTEERLLGCIVQQGVGGIKPRMDAFLPWLQCSLNYTTRFERLVGPQGGGSAEAQQAEIERIGRHLGFSLSPEQVRSIAARLFWEESPTFRRGQIGAWREHFKEEHKTAFKQVAGQLLINLGYERDFDW